MYDEEYEEGSEDYREVTYEYVDRAIRHGEQVRYEEEILGDPIDLDLPGFEFWYDETNDERDDDGE